MIEKYCRNETVPSGGETERSVRAVTAPACAMFALAQSCSLKFLQVFPDLPAAKRLLLARLFLPVPRTLMLSALSHVIREPFLTRWQQDCRRLSKRALFRVQVLGIVPSERLRCNASDISELIMQWRKNTPLNARKFRGVFYWTYVRKTSLRKTKGCLPEALCVIQREPGSRR